MSRPEKTETKADRILSNFSAGLNYETALVKLMALQIKEMAKTNELLQTLCKSIDKTTT